ncbi:MAG: hypothetical protein E3J56_07610 [Candidatus Aminicenantes bacterium]|nr:MAG: hypothetical protein E3J56_07610 [Candidatus Aminicenantes bacterium]
MITISIARKRFFGNLSPLTPLYVLLGDPIPFIPFPLSRGRGRFLKRGAPAPLKHTHTIMSIVKNHNLEYCAKIVNGVDYRKNQYYGKLEEQAKML